MRVLQSVKPPGESLKYIDQVVRHAPPDIDFLYFSWRVALFGNYAAFHVHWPEHLIRHPNRIIGFAQSIFARALIFRLSAMKTPVLRTVHNLTPHDLGSSTEDKLVARLEKLATAKVVLNEYHLDQFPGSTLIPHGHYVGKLEHTALRNTEDLRICFVGRIEPYKGVDQLISLLDDLHREGVHLHIAGKAGPDMTREIIEAMHSHSNLSVDLRWLSDSEISEVIMSSALVVLPYSRLHNSGIMFLALSLGRPVLVEDNPVTREIQRELGNAWIRLYNGKIGAKEIKSALDGPEVKGLPRFKDSRSWPNIASAYADLYRKISSCRDDV